MIVEYIRYTIPAARSSAFETAYTAAGGSLDASPHCLGWELTRGVEDPANYILRIEWDSLEGHDQGFRHSQEFRSFFQHIRPYVSDIVEMRHYAAVLDG
jgi:heme-degrading monooxygenase HmoA